MEQTINQVFYNRVKKYGDRIAVEKKLNGKWESVSWNIYYEKAKAIGNWLLYNDISKNDHIAILSENRLEWLFTDMGGLGIGCAVVPIYTTLTGEEIKHIFNQSDAKILFLENRNQLNKISPHMDDMPKLSKIVVFDEAYVKQKEDKTDIRIATFKDVLLIGQKLDKKYPTRFQEYAKSITPDDLASIIYTSGTTGIPKGVMVTHGNIMAVINSLDNVRPRFATDSDQTVPFLPLSHSFERIAGHFFGMYVGITASYAESIQTFAQDIKEKQPTIMLAVPRVCEKVFQTIKIGTENEPVWKRAIFGWGLGVGTQINDIRETKKKIPIHLKLQYEIAYRLVFKKLAQALGGRIRYMTAAGAPTSPEIISFFNAAGIKMIEGYGLTETCAPMTLSSLTDYRIGTVGEPLPDMSVKLAEDGEILAKGGSVFKGYYKMDAETTAAFTEDGYFRTGDIGKFNGTALTITDRKKDLIITSGGKNVAPQKIEGLFKSDPLFSQFMVVGERRKFLSALMCINPDYAKAVAERNDIAFRDMSDLLSDERFLKIVEERVQQKNYLLAQYEGIKKYKIIPEEFSQEGGELTVSMKMKRNVILNKYRSLIEQMYV